MPLVDAHTLERDFPEHADTIRRLDEENLEFRSQHKKYHKLDKKIRGLEGKGVATDDQHFSELKMERAQVKYNLYHWITNGAPLYRNRH